MTNHNPDTGIAYGYISSKALDSDIEHELLFGSQATNESYKDALEESRPSPDPETGEPVSAEDMAVYESEFGEDYRGEEDTISGTYQGVKYQTSWLGGALNFWIFESPHTTDKARRASPCVPGAGILDTLDGDVTSYDVPADWRN